MYGGTDVFCDSKKVETSRERSTAGNTRSGEHSPKSSTESGKASDSGDYDKTQERRAKTKVKVREVRDEKRTPLHMCLPPNIYQQGVRHQPYIVMSYDIVLPSSRK